MHLQSILCLSGALLMPVELTGQDSRPCPPVRSVEQRSREANAVVLGEVTYAHECFQPKDNWVGDGDRATIPDCIGGQRADVRVEKVWKGNLKVGDTVGLVVAGHPDSSWLFWRPGERHVVFADAELLGRMWWGSADACEATAGISESVLIADLEARYDSRTTPR
jgi:hypothetical protein